MINHYAHKHGRARLFCSFLGVDLGNRGDKKVREKKIITHFGTIIYRFIYLEYSRRAHAKTFCHVIKRMKASKLFVLFGAALAQEHRWQPEGADYQAL